MQDIGHTGLNNLLAAYDDKGAKAVCTFGFSQGPGHEPILFQGITDVSFYYSFFGRGGFAIFLGLVPHGYSADLVVRCRARSCLQEDPRILAGTPSSSMMGRRELLPVPPLQGNCTDVR